jgi:glutathione-specific gamma-glutamylcyclotransferase
MMPAGESRPAVAIARPSPSDMSDFWVFGYGSLMWRPGFEHLESSPARLVGAHRALCVYSWVHRGTRERPGLVLGLDRGGSCRGIAFRVAGEKRETVIAYLRERELVTNVYREAWRAIRIDGPKPRTETALTYLVDPTHEQYAGKLSREVLLSFVRDGVGRSGVNADYVVNTAGHLVKLGLRDPVLEWLAEELKQQD